MISLKGWLIIVKPLLLTSTSGRHDRKPTESSKYISKRKKYIFFVFKFNSDNKNQKHYVDILAMRKERRF
jgi:hypothetical protein